VPTDTCKPWCKKEECAYKQCKGCLMC
jgi:hypothetical protein